MVAINYVRTGDDLSGQGRRFCALRGTKGKERKGRAICACERTTRTVWLVASLMICGLGGRTAGPIAELNILLRGIEGCVKDSEGSGSVK